MHPIIDDLIRCLMSNAAEELRSNRVGQAAAMSQLNKMREISMNKTNKQMLEAMISLYGNPDKQRKQPQPAKKPKQPAKAQDAARRKPGSGKVKNQVFNIIGTTRGRAMDESYSLALGRKPNEVVNALKGL